MIMTASHYRTRTRSTADGAPLLCLPNESTPIYIDCSELYALMNNDCLTYVLDVLYAHDTDLQEKKNDHIRKLSKPKMKIAHDFLHTMASKLNHDAQQYKYIGYSEEKKLVTPWLNQKIGYLHKVYFRNTASHIQGCMDGILRRDLLLPCLDMTIDPGPDYVILYLCDSVHKLSEYHRRKAEMVLLYGAALYPEYVDSERLILVDKNGETKILMLSEKERADIRTMVRDVRRIKRVAPCLGAGDLIERLREANVRFLPNMESKVLRNDKIWKPIKKQMSYELGEITELWMCSDQHRQRAFSHGVRSWRDPHFTPTLVGITENKKASTLEKIVQINRQDPDAENFEWMRVDPELSNKWPILMEPGASKKHAFFDFEYLEDGTIYMIGVYWGSQYHCLWASALTPEAEKNLLQEFNTYCTVLSNRYPGMRFWYWHAEKTMWRKQCLRHGLEKEASEINNWHDACDLMRSGTVVVHGALDFSLKSMIPAFHRHGKVPFRYCDLDCEDGEASIAIALSYYREGRSNDSLRETLEAYNRIDCEAVKCILTEIIGILQTRAGVEALDASIPVEWEAEAEAAAVAGILALAAAGCSPPSCQIRDS